MTRDRAAAPTPSGPTTATRRDEIERLIADGRPDAAAAALGALWTADGGPAAAAYVVSRFEQLRGGLDLRKCRVAILRSFTVEPIVPMLRAGGYAAGMDVAVYASDFNAHVQDIVSDGSPLYAFEPDAVILAVQTRDVAPELWRGFADLDSAGVEAVVSRVAAEVRGWIASFRSRSRAHLIVHNFEEPHAPSWGVLDAQRAGSQSEAVRRINRELQQAAAAEAGVYVLDYDGLVARHGRTAWHDERKWLTVRLPMAAGCLPVMAREWLRFLQPLAGRVAKAVVVDLDNTLWGGVVGEDGRDGLRLGIEHPGAAYREVQRALLDLRRRGVLLAICSKNNPDEALDALRHHPGMVLKPSDFSAMRINWADKAQNLGEIAAELNIGVDALAFVDDNPIERQHVRRALPAVQVIELPDDPMKFADAVRESPWFERLTLSDEDRRRVAMYEAQRERQQMQTAAGSREEFLRSLQQVVTVAPVTTATLARVAQLTSKTNQFNLTTRRYTEQQILDIAARADAACYSVRVEDRFGDNGLTGVAIMRLHGDVCEVENLLLSCRVIGRTVETAVLSYVTAAARRRGARRLQGWFLPTKKNAPASAFYPSHGFRALEERDDGTLWGLDLEGGPLPCPEWIDLRSEGEGDS